MWVFHRVCFVHPRANYVYFIVDESWMLVLKLTFFLELCWDRGVSWSQNVVSLSCLSYILFYTYWVFETKWNSRKRVEFRQIWVTKRRRKSRENLGAKTASRRCSLRLAKLYSLYGEVTEHFSSIYFTTKLLIASPCSKLSSR